MKRAIKSAMQRSALALGYHIDRDRMSFNFDWPKFSKITAADDSILKRAKQHLDATPVNPPGLPNLGVRWGTYAARLRDRVRTVHSADELLVIGQSPVSGVESHLPPSELAGFCQWLDLDLLTQGLARPLYEALPSFRAPKMTPRGCIVEHRGTPIDFVTMCAARNILQILDWLADEKPRTICDIGGGTGKYTHAWMTNSVHRPELVIILDIPETLIYSETLLRTVFPDVQYLVNDNDIPNKSGIVLCPINNVKALDGISFDLVTNYGSMQGMSDAWIDWYMMWLDQRDVRHFYSDNYFANALMNMREGHNSWSPRPSPKWTMEKSRVQLGMRNNALLLFSKGDNIAINGPRAELKGADLWLSLLDGVRRSPNETNLRRAIDFALAGMPFIPKEAWQLSKMLSELSRSELDAELFANLQRMRARGVEAVT